MATFPPEQIKLIVQWTRETEIMSLQEYIHCIRVLHQGVFFVVLRVCSSNGEAKKWLRAFNHKGGYESWLKNKTNSQQQQKRLS